MDPLDSGEAPKEDSVRKLERGWEPVPWDPEVWRGKGLKPEVERLMTEGVDVLGPDTPGFYEVPQYPFGGWELEQKGGEEADRAIVWRARWSTCPSARWTSCSQIASCTLG